MAKDVKQKKPDNKSGELVQLLLSNIVIGLFLLIETWLLFFYNGSFVFPLIFGVLIILMTCLNTLNIYQIFVKRLSSGGGGDKKAEYLIYKEIKSLPDEMRAELKSQLESTQEELSAALLKSTRAIFTKVDKQLQESTSEMEGQFENSAGELQSRIVEMKTEMDNLKQQLDEINNKLDEINLPVETAVDTANEEEPVSVEDNAAPLNIDESFDPNKELTPEEIAAMFANV